MMPRKYERKTDRGSYGQARLQAAVKEMQEKGQKLRVVARKYGIPKSTVERHVKNKIQRPESSSLGPTSCFSAAVEGKLKNHILTLESRGFGLTPMEVRSLAFDFAEANGIRHRFNMTNCAAGYDWLQGFVKRHPELSLRKPEPLSLARSMGMNRVRMKSFQSLLQDVFTEEELFGCPQAVYNVVETGISLVHKHSKIHAAKGKKNIYATTRGEKGTTTTAVICGNAAGEYVPPCLIFKGKRHNQALAAGAPPGSMIELSESGWIDREIFQRWLRMFNQHAKRNARGKCLLIMDGHASYLTVEVLNYAAANDIMLVCLPPHSSHWLQPLDRTVLKSLKSSYDKTCAKYMRENPRKVITRYEISKLFCTAYLSAASMSNLMNGFKYTGIFPLDANAIPERAFTPSDTTDQAMRDVNQRVRSVPGNEGSSAGEGTKLDDGSPAERASTSSQTSAPGGQAEIAPGGCEGVAENQDGNSSFKDIIPLPKPAPVKRKRKSLSGLVTSPDVISELAQQKNQKESVPKEKSHKKSVKTSIASKPKGEGAVKKSAMKDVEDVSNYCGYCDGCYFDDDDENDDWLL